MSLLNQFGFQPLQKTDSLRGGKPMCCITINLSKNSANYALSLAELVKNEKLDWDAVDIAFSKEHGAMVVAKGTAFPFNKDKNRLNGVDIYKNVWKFFALKPVKTKARVIFSYSLFSENVYFLKVDKIDFNY